MGAFNIGTGQSIAVAQVAAEIVQLLGSNSPLSITGAFRYGDIRHNFADMRKTTNAIGFVPRYEFRNGVQSFLTWAESQECCTIHYQSSLREMRDRGFLNG